MPWDLTATSLPQGPLRDMEFVNDVATNDFELDDGEHFICHVATAGNLRVETVTGTIVNSSSLEAGDAVAVAGVPVGIRKIVAAGTTVTSVAIGRG